MFSVKAKTFFVYKKNTTLIKEGLHAFCCPHHVSTAMKKIVKLLVKTSKNIYGKKKKHVRWIMVMITSFLHLSHHDYHHPMKKNHS
jgi:hypothetical protein